MPTPIAIRRYLDIDPTPERVTEIDAIFFESSNTKAFESDAARAAFRERWLGRYLTHDPQYAVLAQTADGKIVGYLVGAIDDPARSARFGDIGYFGELSAVTPRYPAHFHVNISPAFRNRRIGERLVAAFLSAAKAAGAHGVHVVTSAGARNVAFYERNGFSEVARAGREGRLVFLGRRL